MRCTVAAVCGFGGEWELSAGKEGVGSIQTLNFINIGTWYLQAGSGEGTCACKGMEGSSESEVFKLFCVSF